MVDSTSSKISTIVPLMMAEILNGEVGVFLTSSAEEVNLVLFSEISVLCSTASVLDSEIGLSVIMALGVVVDSPPFSDVSPSTEVIGYINSVVFSSVSLSSAIVSVVV